MIKRNKAYNQFIFFQLEGVSVKQGDNLVQKDSVNTELIKTELEKNHKQQKKESDYYLRESWHVRSIEKERNRFDL